jgi:hypothetical protein
MSDTETAIAAIVAEDTAAVPATETEIPPSAEVFEPEAKTEPEPEPAPKPKPAERRFAALTAKLGDKDRRLAELERQLTEARAKLAPEDKSVTDTSDVIEQEVQRRLEEREFKAKLNSFIAAGEKELGRDEWNKKTNFLRDMGATLNPAFLTALVEAGNAGKLVTYFDQEPEVLASIMDKPPVAMAAALGRLATQINQPAPKNVLSSAPRPAAPVKAVAVAPEPSLDDESLPMDEWVKVWDKRQAERRAARH